MSTRECPHGEIDPTICPPCQGTAARPHKPHWSHAFPALYGGFCGECGYEIRPGHLIRLRERSDGSNTAAHDHCTDR